MNCVSLWIAGAVTVGWLCFIYHILTYEGGVRSWWRDGDTVRPALNAIGAFGILVAVFWIIALWPA